MVRGGVQEATVTLLLLACLGITCVTYAASGSTPGVLYESTLPGAVDRGLLMDPSDFLLPHLQKQCLGFVAEHPRMKLSRLFVATARHLAAAAQSGKGTFHTDFGHWTIMVDSERQKQGSAAECIQIGNSIVLRVAWENGQVQEVVLRGRNPLHQRVGRLNVDLKWLFTSKAHLTGQHSLNVSLGTDGLVTEKDAVAIATRFDRELGVRPVWYEVRADPWFVTDDFYPWINPFYPITTKPSREEYMKTYSYLCNPEPDSARISCSRFGPRVP